MYANAIAPMAPRFCFLKRGYSSSSNIIKIDKLLRDLGYGSRREAQRLLDQGRVKIVPNGAAKRRTVSRGEKLAADSKIIVDEDGRREANGSTS